jgi:hypothetical protein
MFSADYESLSVDGAGLYSPVNAVPIQGDKFTVFDGASHTETRYVPWEVKEHVFKHSMGIMGTATMAHVCPMIIAPWVGQLACAGFMANMTCRIGAILTRCIRRVELHADGQTVTMHSTTGKTVTAKITDIKKLRHEKTLVETYEESFLFPITVNGTKWYLNGQGHESIKHGEAFRAIINGQAIKL